MSDEWAGRRVTAARAQVATWLPAPCGKCRKTVTANDRWVVGHIKARATHPHLTWTVSNWWPEHKACSDKTGQATVIAKAKAEALAEHGIFPDEHAPAEPPLLPKHTHERQHEPFVVRADLRWTNPALSKATWLSGLLEIPEDAAPPLAMSGPHPEAVGSYGAEAIAWVKSELGISLRWWQRLAFTRQLEHREDGSLCWRTVLESGPRRVGKSVRLRAMGLWRLDHADLFGEQQLAIHTGKDVAIVREIHRQAWAWAHERDGWDVRKGVGQEEVRKHEVNRWLVRSTDAVYGYDVCLGMVDEAWAVDPGTFEEGLEPATLERLSPQLLLTSTAHRRATTLMRKRLSAALAEDDGETLLMWWGAPPDADVSDPATWRAASPHWSPDRAKMVAAKYTAALAGETDAEAGDVGMAAFTSQYLNTWNLTARAQTKGDALTTDDAWDALRTHVPSRTPDAAAIEAWFDAGTSVAFAWRTEGPTVVRVIDAPDLSAAVTAIKATGYRGAVTVGASLLGDPALKGLRVRKGQGRTTGVVAELGRLLSEDAIGHDGSASLREQVTAVRTTPGTEGPRIVSKGRADALKAALWALDAARKKKSSKPRILLPTG